MGTCIICGSTADGDICGTHEQDAFFEFRGDRPEQLTTDRYYRGTVDGFAEFGVFVDVGTVTGLLHRSEIPKRLESLDWEPGEEVFVQVLDIHDNGNIDLGWSLRQEPREFRGHLIDDPEIGKPVTADTVAEPATDEADSSTSDDEAATAADREETETIQTDDEDQDAARSSMASQPESGFEPATESVPETKAGTEPGSKGASAADSSEGSRTASGSQGTFEPAVQSTEERAATDESATSSSAKAQETAEKPGSPEGEPAEAERVPVESLEDHLGEIVAVEGEITDIRQTSGPTVFELSDETDSVECAAFKSAGVRAYPEVDLSDIVRLVGEVERRRGDLQIETTSLEVLESEAAEAVETRLADALRERARPVETDLLVDDPDIAVVKDDLIEAATVIRRAVLEPRPVIVRHTATLEGYVAGTALERALLPLVRAEHEESAAEYHYVDRRPLDDPFYDIDAATDDVTDMLEAADRHGEKHPLFVLVDAGSTRESIDGLEFLSIYDAESVVIDGGFADADAADAAEALVSPTAAGADPVPTGVLGVHLAGIVNSDVRDDLTHLPAASYWDGLPDRYGDLAKSAGYDLEAVRSIRNAVALEAFYQSYEDKRELIADLFWDERNLALAEPISEQFRTKLEAELETAEPHLEDRNREGVSIAVLDVDAYTHQYDFPPVRILIDQLHRRRDPPEPSVTIGFKRDELLVTGSEWVDVRGVGEAVAERLPEAGVTPRGGRDGTIEFLSGERDAVLEAAVEEIAARLA
ncbi:MAG: OB-fold nucleic acid binding domain-containing protein [Halodesulfurarchaeum sp.]